MAVHMRATVLRRKIMGTQPHIPLKKKVVITKTVRGKDGNVQRGTCDNGERDMVRRGDLTRQTDNETADEEAGKGERNDFTSGEPNRHGGGDGRPEGRLNFNH